MAAPNQPLTFISYSRADSQFALELAKELRSSGFKIWLDQLDIPTGSRWDDEVEKALLQCEIFMVILTPRSIVSNNVKDEIGYAIDSNKRIMPVLLENATVPFRLRRFQYVDFTGKSYDEGIESAKELLRGLIYTSMPASESVAVPVGTRTDGVRVLPKRLIDQQMQQGQMPPMVRANQSSQPRPTPAPQPDYVYKSKSKSSWTGNLIPIMMGLALLFMVCIVAVWMMLPYLPGRGTGSNIISVTTAAPMVQIATTTAPTVKPTGTTRPTDTATFTFTPEPTITVTAISPTNPIVNRKEPEEFIVDYFNFVIRDHNFEKGWSLLTPEYQQKKAISWDTYVGLWKRSQDWQYSSLGREYISPPRALVVIRFTIYYNDGTAPSTVDTKYCLLQTNTLDSWQIDLIANCP